MSERIIFNRIGIKILRIFNEIFTTRKMSFLLLIIIILVNIISIELIYASTEFEVNSISDKYMENVILSSNRIAKRNKIKMNRISNDDSRYKENSGTSDDEIIINYYSEYISQINNLDENEKEKKLFFSEEINKNNMFSSKIFSKNTNEKENQKSENLYFSSESEKTQNLDLYDEVISEIMNTKFDERKIFEFSLKTLYGNTTLLNFNINDLENLIKFNYLTDGQAILLWETLTMIKTDRLKNLNFQKISEGDNEIYIFNFIPLKSIGLFFLSSGIFIIGYNILINFNSKDRDKTSYLFNIILTTFSLYITENFYLWKYYLSSTICFLLFLCSLKFLIDSLYSKLGFPLEDYNVFGNYSKTKNFRQFTLKFIILLIGSVVVGLLSFIKFPHFYNYILFYICITQGLNLISVFFQYEVPTIFQPFRHFIMIIFGIFNFLMINFHQKNYLFNDFFSLKKQDSFYIIGDLYTYLCFSFLYDYLFTQSNNISNLFYERTLDNEKINSQISSIMREYSELNRDFTGEDIFWIFGFFLGVWFQYVALIKNKYLVFYLSFYFFKTVFAIFGRIYHVKFLRFFYNIILFICILSNNLMSNRNDECLFEILGVTNVQVISIIKFFARFIGLIYVLIYIFQNNEYITTNKYDENISFPNEEDTKETIDNQIYKKEQIYYDSKRNKKIKTIHISLVKEKKPKFTFKNIMYIQIDIYGTYLIIYLLFLLIKEVENNILILFLYYMIIIFLMTKMLFFINEFKNDTEYLYAFSLVFFIGIRMITHTINLKTSFVISCTNLFSLIVIYCLNERRKIFFTVFILFHLYSACIFLSSNFIMILIIILLFVPLFLIKNDNKLNCSIMSVFFPLFIIISIQIYGFRNLVKNLMTINKNLASILKYDIFNLAQSIVHGEYVNEFEMIKRLTDFLKKYII